MTTSITDARFTSLHFTSGHLLSLDIDDPPEDGWSVMPGYDQSIPIPAEFEPPMADFDETLPNMIHPSYPFGRPPTLSKPLRQWMGHPSNLLGTVGGGSTAGTFGGSRGWDERWDELGMEDVVESQYRKEVPPGMAGAKRPPSPPSPSLHPHSIPAPRSQHLRNLYARQRQATPPAPADPFDAPVPNETYADEDVPHDTEAGTSPRGGVTGTRGNLGDADDEDEEDEEEGAEEDAEEEGE